MSLEVSSFYKYVRIENPAVLQSRLWKLCKSLELRGRILLGKEGINGSVCGKKERIQEFKEKLTKNQIFSGIDFKEQSSEKQAFSRLYIAIKKEIVNFGLKVDLSKTAPFVTPKELKSMLDKKEDIVLLDVRNDYETKIGKFRDSRVLNIGNFRDLPKAISGINELKSKKIVTYCTGGIRCEKASVFLREQGFEDIHQLKGGILKFGEAFPDTYWQGKCFVFDNRISIEINKKANDFFDCDLCSKMANDYLNCHNLDCDKLFSCCDGCKIEFNASCSLECSKAPNRRKKDVADLSNAIPHRNNFLSLVKT